MRFLRTPEPELVIAVSAIICDRMRKMAANPPSTAVTAFGVGIQLTVSDASLWPAVRSVLPPTAVQCDPRAVSVRLGVEQAGEHAFKVTVDDQLVAVGVKLEMAVGVLDAQMRAVVAAQARDWVFVHAGVVGVGDRALLIPGASFTGKTTLVAALARAGADYYSDEFAVLDNHGHVHPYPKPLSIRLAEVGRTREIAARDLGASTGERALSVGLIVITSFELGANWQPEQRPASAGALALLSNAVPARERPEQSLRAVSQAAAEAIILESERGEADVTAVALLAALGA